MKPKIRIIKHGEQKAKEPEPERQQQPSRPSTRDITSTIKLWVSECQERRRNDEHRIRSANKQSLTRL
jgi:hypothetical protein